MFFTWRDFMDEDDPDLISEKQARHVANVANDLLLNDAVQVYGIKEENGVLIDWTTGERDPDNVGKFIPKKSDMNTGFLIAVEELGRLSLRSKKLAKSPDKTENEVLREQLEQLKIDKALQDDVIRVTNTYVRKPKSGADYGQQR